MGRTLLELFKTKTLAGGQTAAVEYDVRNSKDAPIRPYIGALNLSFRAATKIRQGIGVRTSESFFEQETTGLRIIRTLSSPIIYGTDLIRLTRQSTDAVNEMKNSVGAGGDSGVLGNLIEKAKGKVSKLGAKLGIVPPQILIPTRISLNDKFKAGKEPDTMATLAEIKEDARGTLVGRLLAKNAKGTPKQIGNQVLGGVINLAKQEVRKKLFGGRKDGQQNFAKKSESEIQYDSFAPYTSTVDYLNDNLNLRNDLSSQYAAYKAYYPDLYNDIANINTGKNQLGKQPATLNASPGRTPNGTVNVPKPDPIDLAKSRKQGQIEVGIKLKDAKDNGTLKYDPEVPATAYSNTIDELADDPMLRNDLSTKLLKLTGTTAENENKNAASTNKSASSKSNFKNSVSGIKDALPKSSKDLFGKLATSANVPKSGIPNSVPTIKKPNPADLVNARKLGQVKLGQKEQSNAPKADIDPLLKNDPSVPSTAYSNTIDETSTDIKTRNDLSSILNSTQTAAGVNKPDSKNVIGIRNKGIPINQEIKTYTQLVGQAGELEKLLGGTQSSQLAGAKASQELNKVGVGNSGIPTKKEKVFGDPDKTKGKSIKGKLGVDTNTGDYVNSLNVGEEKDAKGKDIANYDFMLVRFKHYAGPSVSFRGTITGYQETFTPTWDTNKFIGSPFNFYTYTGIERSLSFNLRVYSMNPTEHDNMWNKLEQLAKLVYPISNGPAIIPPLLFFSMGNPEIGGSVFQNKECFIDSLSYTADDATPWEIGGFSPGYQAPMIIDVSIGVKFIQGLANTNSLYGFTAGKNKYTNERTEKKNKADAKKKESENKTKTSTPTQRNNSGGKINKAAAPKVKGK